MNMLSLQMATAIASAVVYLLVLLWRNGVGSLKDNQLVNVIAAALSGGAFFTSLTLISLIFNEQFLIAVEPFFIDPYSVGVGGGIGLGYLSISAFVNLLEKTNPSLVSETQSQNDDEEADIAGA